MIYNEKLLRSLIDKHLESYKTSLSKIHEEEAELQKDKKGKKKLEPWYTRYPFENSQEYEKWFKWAKAEVGKFYKGWDEKKLDHEFTFIDAMIAASQPYLFKKVPEGQLF